MDTETAESKSNGIHGKPAPEFPECGHGMITGNSSRCAPSLLSLGAVAILTKTDGAYYEPLITFGAKEDALETAPNSKGPIVKSHRDGFKIAHTEVSGEREAIVGDTKIDLEAETPAFDTYTVISDLSVLSNTETAPDKGRGHALSEKNKVST